MTTIWTKALKAMGLNPKTKETPQLPESTLRTRGDSWANTYSGLGTTQYDPSVQTQYYTTYDITVRPQVIRAMMRSNPLGRKIVEKQVRMAWGSGVDYQVSGGGDSAETDLHGELRRLEVQSRIQRARVLGRAFGGSLLVMSFDDGMDPSEPLNLNRVRRLLFLRPVDRWDIPSQELDTSGGPRDGEVEHYIISSSNTGTRVRIHHSRVIRFEGLEVDRYTKGSIGNWGDSVLQPVYDAVRDIDSGGQSLSSQLATAVQSVYKIKGLHEQILAGNREFIEDWMASLELFRSHLRAVGLDADNEDLQYLARPLGDSVQVYHALMHRVAAAADMPVTELFGMSPSGLSTDDQSGTRRFYDKVTAEERQGEQGRALDRVLEIITNQSLVPSLNGSEVRYHWPSLYSPTAKEEAELTKLRADTAIGLIGAGVITPEEVRSIVGEMLSLDLETQEEEEDSLPSDAILDPAEKVQQARLAIQSGLLHLPDTASTFRPMLGLDPLQPGDTEQWFNLVKTSEGQTLQNPPNPEESRGDVLAQIRFRFVDQAERIADDRTLVPWSTIKTAIQRELEGLPAKDNQRLMPYAQDQYALLQDDHEEFMSKRDPENYNKAEVKRMGKTRASLRADQIIRMVEQGYARADIAANGVKFFEWRSMGDDRVRPAHVELDGKVFPLDQGDPEEGFPGDAHNCRCVAVPVTVLDVIQGDEEKSPLPVCEVHTKGDEESFIPPAGVQRAAQSALRVRRQSVPSQRGMTSVGLARARDLANGRPVSEETIRRMLNYFTRHEVDKEGSTWEEKGKGWQAWNGWGGDPGFRWVKRIVERLDREKGDQGPASTPAKPSERITGSRKNPEGSASGSRGGIQISESTEKSLKKKVEEHNEEHGDDPAKRVDLGKLKAVFRRGAGAFSTSHRPGMTRNQWALGRVNAFMFLLRNGRPERASYTTDNDLLPEEHAKSTKKKKED